MADFTTLTEATARDLIDLLRRDRSNPRGGPAMVGNFVPQGPLVTRWAKTSTTPDYGTYPSSGNVVGVKFGEYEPSPIYPGSTATKTFTAYDPAWYEFATLENGTMPAVDTIVRCTWRDGRWWILQDSTGTSIPTAIMFNGNGYNTDAGSRTLLKYYGVSHANNRDGYWHFLNGWGDFATTGVDMMTTASSVGATTHDETDASFKLTQGGLYRFIVHFECELDTTLQPSNDTYTSGTTSAHTHTYEFPREISSRIKCLLQWRNTGGGAWQTTNYQMTGWTAQDVVSSIQTNGYDASSFIDGTFVFWQNHNQVDREYRLRVILYCDWPTSMSAGTHMNATMLADSALIAVTRMADYSADQTLAY